MTSVQPPDFPKFSSTDPIDPLICISDPFKTILFITLNTWRFHRYALQLLAPAAILANIAGRKQIELEDINEMGELFLDAKTSAEAIGQGEGYKPL